MAKIPIKFHRVAEAFDEATRWRRRCESSSGSEYWPESGASLSDLVNSFIEKGDGLDLDPFDMDMNTDMAQNDDKEGFESDDDSNNNNGEDKKRKKSLREILLECNKDNKKDVKQRILNLIKESFRLIGENDDIASSTTKSRSGLKRNVMSRLRDKGFDAGICKSRWEKTCRFPAGTYEYIDVNVGKTRYIVELFMARELDIARPTTRYTALLDMIPSIIIIGKPQLLKQLIRVMSTAMKESLNHVDMYVAPWRRNGYIQARYFSPYKRTINPESSSSTGKMVKEGLTMMKESSMVGFTTRVSYYCRDDGFVSKCGIRVGLLGALLQQK